MEKNRKILDEALQQLRSYTPDEKVWEAVQSQLAEATIAEGLSKLKSIVPPQKVWNAIANELDKHEKIGQLKEFTPGDEIWNRIDATLNVEEAKSRKLIIFRWTTLLAAAGVAIIMAYFLLFPNQQKSNISYSEEVIKIEKPGHWQEDDAEISNLLNALCAANPIACSQPDFKEKQEELDYLNEKKSEILERLNVYDQNKDLQILLTKIELEKNEIVKQMISKTM
ncbi:MAG TPA: hypothetical protein VFC92_12365 [Bacteroidales bacterium]|nr:hypothetical protein [Bacteroidales bacterium]